MRDVIGYEGLYAITEDGDVWSYRANKFLKPCKSHNEYLFVGLHKMGFVENKRINRLVAEAYLPNPNNLSQVGHQDENKLNNNVLNLYWTDAKENNNRLLHKERLGKSKCKKVQCIETQEVFESMKEAAAKKNISYSGLCNHLKGKTKSCGNLHWKYFS